MNIKRTIRIAKHNISQIAELSCVTNVEMNVVTRKCTVHLSDKHTKGRTAAHDNDYIVMFGSGIWQCFGAEAYQRLVLNPSNAANSKL